MLITTEIILTSFFFFKKKTLKKFYGWGPAPSRLESLRRGSLLSQNDFCYCPHLQMIDPEKE